MIALDITFSMRDEVQGLREEVDDLSGILARLDAQLRGGGCRVRRPALGRAPSPRLICE